MTRAEKKAHALAERRIERAYYKSCEGVRVNILDLGKIFDFGHLCIARGDSDEALGSALRAYVDTLKAA